MNAPRLAPFALLALALALSFDLSPPAKACGGPSFASLGAVEKIDATLDGMVMPDPYWNGLAREELRFLYPFLREHPAELKDLWALSYEVVPGTEAPDLAAFDEAAERGDIDAAERAARVVIEAVLDMPPTLAQNATGALWRAVEVVELAPALRGAPKKLVRGLLVGPTPVSPLEPLVAEALEARWAVPGGTGAIPNFTPAHPRAASLELWSLQRAFKKRVPDGYADAVKTAVAPAVFAELERSVDAWLLAHPKHPLVDYARLWKVRIRYFSGDSEGAWQTLLDLYPRHLPRVVGEMRYLLLQGKHPSDKQLDALTDPVLLAGFADEHTITSARFDAWWKLAEAAPTRPSATNLEERLLLWAAHNAKPGALPHEFPKDARTPTPLWGKLRAAALAKAGELDAAKAQLAHVPSDAEQALLAAQFEVARGHAADAAATPGLGDDARTYLLRVRVGQAELESLARSSAPIAKEARFELAVRLAAKGDWRAAAKRIEKDDAERAKVWKHAGTLAARQDAAGALALARFLEENQETLLYPTNPGFYRAVSARYAPRTNAAESEHIEAALTRGTARWLSLEAYARALQSMHGAAAKEALAEADHGYNRLINWAGGGGFWSTYATHTKTVAAIRDAGKVIRRGKATP